MQKIIIGIAGVAQSGKDTLANFFVEKDGFERIGFADAMRNVLYATNPIVSLSYEDRFREIVRVQSVVDAIGWELAKNEYPEIRQLLQQLGTEGGRNCLSEDIWIRTLFERAKKDRLVIPDVRFENEAKAIHDKGGAIIRVARNGYSPVNDHISEVAFLGEDILLENNGTPEQLYEKALLELQIHGFIL